MPREYTIEEVESEFLDYIRGLVDYWENESGKTSREKLEGLAFSILVAIDGEAIEAPSFVLSPICSEEDKEFFSEW